MSIDEYHAVKFTIQRKEFFSIWVATESGSDFFLKDGARVAFFSGREALLDFCKSRGIRIKSETEHDFDFSGGLSCDEVLGRWDIISDLAGTTGTAFSGDMEDALPLYRKLLCGCDLSAPSATDPKQGQTLTPEEKQKLDSVIAEMRGILKNLVS